MLARLTAVGTVDGTDHAKATYDFTCPSVRRASRLPASITIVLTASVARQVTPPAPIYFYQFTSPGATGTLWTTRFTIADASGASVPAPNATEPDGQPIPWGVGALTDPSTAVAAPSYLSGGAASASGSSSGSASASASATSSVSASASATTS